MNAESMTYAYISEPVEFRQLQGKAVDFRKTFDVRGQGNDEMLQLYLRKAHLDENVEQMPAIQRRTYVYDIIRSNKGPGYWVPPSMQLSSDVFAHPPPAVLPPPTMKSSPFNERRTGAQMKSSASSSSLGSLGGGTAPLPGPSFASSVVVSSKGSKYEISGPINFQHVSGDVTRDRTRNAFDLSAGNQDNVLKKYMMEHGITEQDIAGMNRKDIIKNIVHSNATWQPSKAEMKASKGMTLPPAPTPTLVYATINTNNQLTPPPSPKPVQKPLSNYATITSRFKDISDMDWPATPSSSAPRRAPLGNIVPIQVSGGSKVPPPPSTVTAANVHVNPAAVEVRPAPLKTQSDIYATIAPQRKAGQMRVPPPTPPKPTTPLPVQYKAPAAPKLQPVANPVAFPQQSKCRTSAAPVAFTQQSKSRTSAAPVAFPQQSKSGTSAAPVAFPQQSKSGTSAAIPPPPPPPPPAAAVPVPPPPPPLLAAAVPAAPIMQKSEQRKPAPAAGGDNRDAFLESIRNGVALKKVDKKAATISGVKPRAEKKPPAGDFLSELKLGITLRRVKNPADNPFSDANSNADESQA
ncbi:formin-like protein 20 isoform X1 [Drosophila busckii]|uniref:formin-like protein 20 isoform X1 n=1 Tax=Drosophila busckii TaxID=30019 RepID=UPI00083F3FCA|nr:formin-like protein 20 isoform X1 [Drosophila busckii]XP_017848351.1 formin-like protein 20 isoform X1 [Drosophila busckii]XP_017848352.1 formin-like protein 20 isoform X1 [Drosophila busckii]XP_017848353.1 formin-like protein 20 isoform X1 [Drosophila busckii]